MELIVAKFGGTSVGNGERIRKAAQSVVNEYMNGNKVVVVVSAINKTTDEIIDIVDESIGSNVTDKQMAEILSMGEMTSVRIVSAAIESLGVKSEYIDPFDYRWPIITDNNSLEAKIDFGATEEKAKELMKILDQGIIPVVCGFLGRSEEKISVNNNINLNTNSNNNNNPNNPNNNNNSNNNPNNTNNINNNINNTNYNTNYNSRANITTLGRGGSDITAFLLGHCLSADEVIIVTDVKGVMSTDPRKLENAEMLDKISVEELRDLATHGAQVLHPHALKYKDPNISAKIISFEEGDLSQPGTTIVGPINGEMCKSSTLHPEPISVIALVGDNMLKKPGVLSKMTSILSENEINIFGISAGQNSVTIFVNKKDASEAHHLLHEVVVKNEFLSSLSLGMEIAMVTVASPDFIDTPGIISDISEPLRKNNINIVEISSSQTAVVVFVQWEDGHKAHELVKSVLND
ncbi:MAG: aspartate kinase [Methanobacteriaceae archaeon]